MMAYFFWNPNSCAFTIPYLNFPVQWYSIFFALGFYGAVLSVRSLLINQSALTQTIANKDVIKRFVERLTLYSFIGMIIGARAGHILFYDLAAYLEHPCEIVKTWHGGLSSHGAVIGLLISLWLFSRKKYQEPFLPSGRNLLDCAAIASACAAGCIRCGNFFNQEIIGTPSTLPWAIVFGSPCDCMGVMPRHPVQLYEALVSFLLFGILFAYGQKGRFARQGLITGLYLIVTFTSRIMLEMIKVPQCDFDMGAWKMGQVLSLPLVLLGIFLVVQGYAKKSKSS